jgi:hypothetical protein
MLAAAALELEDGGELPPHAPSARQSTIAPPTAAVMPRARSAVRVESTRRLPMPIALGCLTVLMPIASG